MSASPTFAWERRPDGTFVVHDVPIFCECERDGDEYDVAWLEKAFDELRAAAADGHKPPMHVRHNKKGAPEPTAAGHFEATRLGELSLKGERVRAIYADLVFTHEPIFREVQAKRLPYRSVETDTDAAKVFSLALLDSQAPFLEMPMTFLEEEDAASGVTGVTRAPVTFQRSSRRGGPVIGFRRSGSRCAVLWEANVAEASAVAEPPAKKKRLRVSGVDGTVTVFEAEDEKDPKGKKPEGEKAPEAPKPEEKKPATSGKSNAVLLLEQFMECEVPLEDAPGLIRMLTARAKALQDALGGKDDDGEGKDEQEPERAGAEDNTNQGGPKPSEAPANPPTKKEPMNMGASTDTKTPAAVDPEAFAKFQAEQAALRGEVDEFRAERERERAIFQAVKDLEPFNIGGDPEATIRDAVKGLAGDQFRSSLKTFVETSQKLAPKRRGTGQFGATGGAGGVDTTTEYPKEVSEVCKTPEEAELGLRAHKEWSAARQLGVGRSVSFESYFKSNRHLFVR